MFWNDARERKWKKENDIEREKMERKCKKKKKIGMKGKGEKDEKHE